LITSKAAPNQAIEGLVVDLGTADEPAAEVALDPAEHVNRALALQLAGRGRCQVDEVVCLQQLLVAGTLGEKAGRTTEPEPGSESHFGRHPRGYRHFARKTAPIESQSHLDCESRDRTIAIEQPGTGADGGSMRIEERRQAASG
jgi:hypothetical protein